MKIITCPEPGCRMPAEILEQFVLPSTDGPVEHLKTACLDGHVRTPLAASIQSPTLPHRGASERTR